MKKERGQDEKKTVFKRKAIQMVQKEEGKLRNTFQVSSQGDWGFEGNGHDISSRGLLCVYSFTHFEYVVVWDGREQKGRFIVTKASAHLSCMLITGQQEALLSVVSTLGF